MSSALKGLLKIRLLLNNQVVAEVRDDKGWQELFAKAVAAAPVGVKPPTTAPQQAKAPQSKALAKPAVAKKKPSPAKKKAPAKPTQKPAQVASMKAAPVSPEVTDKEELPQAVGNL
jgi:hypothetical protein